MADQNLVKGDSPYPNYLTVDKIPIEGATPPTSFVKGELATVGAGGFLVKITSTKINGLYQVRNAVTGGLEDDDTVTANVNCIRSRILLSMPVGARKGHYVEINGTDGTGNVVISGATTDPLDLGIGRVFELYKAAGLTAAAGELGVVDTGVI